MLFLLVSHLAKVQIFRFRQNTMDYNKAFWPKLSSFFVVLLLRKLEKVLRKVCHSNGNQKRNLMAFVSVAYHLRIGSYERLKFLSTVHLNGATNLGTKAISTPKLKKP